MSGRIIVIGAGMAGLAAASRLAASKIAVTILEARDRIGGRAFTILHPDSEIPIELGAEFIHGLAPEILDPLRAARIPTTEVDGDSYCVSDAGIDSCGFFSQVNSLLENMTDAASDEPFLDWLHRQSSPAWVRQRATDYVAGFNAADPSLVGVHWLVQQTKAEEQIEGERAFHAKGGYASLIEIFQKNLTASGATIETGTVVKNIDWTSTPTKVEAHNTSGIRSLEAERVLITLPLAILQAQEGQAAVRFTPALPSKKVDAMANFEMGKVIRLVLRFRHRFWENIRSRSGTSLSNLSFLFSQDKWFPTWWTAMPEKTPVLTGWAPFQAAERLSGKEPAFVVDRGLEALAALFQIDKSTLRINLETAHFHDWQSDPFSGGAYSYGKVGAVGAEAELGAPLDGKLFFAGEATDVTGNNGTVHGAIASGYRAAQEILKSVSAQ